MYSTKQITNENVWSTFVDEIAPSTFLHAWAWGEVEKAIGRNIHRYGVYDESDELVAVVLGVVVRARRGDMIICPHGPVISEAADKKQVIAAAKKELKAVGKKEGCVVLRICPILFNTHEYKKYFKELGFRDAPIHVYSELSWILDISPEEDELLKNMKKNTRYGVRKAVKDGVEIESSTGLNDFDRFWNIYMDTAERQSFVAYPRQMLEAELKYFLAEKRAKLYFATHEGKDVSTAFIVYGAESAFYHHGASLPHGSITPGEALQWQIIKDAKAAELKKYNFWGVVPDEDKDHPWYGLSKFKKGFGGYSESYVHTQDYPLSLKYWFTYLVETIRRKKRNV